MCLILKIVKNIFENKIKKKHWRKSCSTWVSTEHHLKTSQLLHDKHHLSQTWQLDNQWFNVNLFPLHLSDCGFQLQYKMHGNLFPVSLGPVSEHIICQILMLLSSSIHPKNIYGSLPCARHCSRHQGRRSEQNGSNSLPSCSLYSRRERQERNKSNKLYKVISYRLNVCALS